MVEKQNIPNTWQVVNLNTVSEIIMGQAPDGISYNSDGNGLPLIAGAGDLGELFPSTNRWTTSPTALSKENDLIFCIRATIGEINISNGVYCLGRGVAAIRSVDALINYRFLFYWLKFIKESFVNKGAGTTFLQIRKKDLENSVVVLPTLPEQDAIVNLLNEVEDIKSKRKQLYEKSTLLPNSIFTELFGIYSKGNFNTSIKLGAIADVVSGVTLGRKLANHRTVKTPYLRVANVQDGYIDISDLKAIAVLPSEIEKYALQCGDIVITEGGDFDKLGRGAIWDYDIPNCIHQNHIFRIRLNTEILSPIFFHHYLQTNFVRQYFIRSAKRTTNLASINISQLKALPVPIPPIDLQRKFEKLLEQVNKNNDIQSESKSKIEDLITSISIRAFSGQLTEYFRKREQFAISTYAKQRDEALKLKSAPVEAEVRELPTELSQDIFAFLSEEQQTILENALSKEGYLLADNDFNDLSLPPSQVQRNLDLLAEIGLLKSVNIPIAPGEIGNVFYTIAYRALKKEDDTKESDIVNLENYVA